MALDDEVDRAYPQRWIGKVTVATTDGRTLTGRVDEPKGDPGNTLTRRELKTKALRLAEFSGAASPDEMRALFERVWTLKDATSIGDLMSDDTATAQGLGRGRHRRRRNFRRIARQFLACRDATEPDRDCARRQHDEK
jgi:hypothetical protein